KIRERKWPLALRFLRGESQQQHLRRWPFCRDGESNGSSRTLTRRGSNSRCCSPGGWEEGGCGERSRISSSGAVKRDVGDAGIDEGGRGSQSGGVRRSFSSVKGRVKDPGGGGKDSGSIRFESWKFRCKYRMFQQVGRSPSCRRNLGTSRQRRGSSPKKKDPTVMFESSVTKQQFSKDK
ncbi:hypothetical protein LINGRAHAP2_LOCUS27880, partial [Linum grandiflorum]